MNLLGKVKRFISTHYQTIKDAFSNYNFTWISVGRTFGLRRRMQFFLWLPISFKLGVVVTLLLVLTTMSLKTLILGFIILLLLLHHTNGHTKLWGAQRTSELSDFYKNVHIYVHNVPLESQHQNYVESWHGSSPTAIYHV